MPPSTNDFDILTFIVQRIVPLLVSSGILGRIKHGTLTFEFKIADEKVTYAKPHVELGIKL